MSEVRAVTLDTNCLLDFEHSTPNTVYVGDLVTRHQRGEIELRLPAISASESQPGGGRIENFAVFKSRVEAAGLGAVRLVKPIAYWDVTFWDFCLYADEPMRDLERKIHAVLHATIEFEYADYCAARDIDPDTKPLDRKWRNAKCDVLVA